jgi:hypothetical protein
MVESSAPVTVLQWVNILTKLTVLRLHNISSKMINEDGAAGEMAVGREKSKCCDKTYPCAILFTKNPI